MSTKAVTLGIALGALVAVRAAHADEAQAARGKAVYAEQKCKLCHSIAGEGNAKGALDEAGTKLGAAELKQWLVAAKEMAAKTKATRQPPMKSYATLPPADVEALVAYLQTLKKK